MPNALGNYTPPGQLTPAEKANIEAKILQSGKNDALLLQQAKEALAKGPEAWNVFVDTAKKVVNPINQGLADWESLKNLPALLKAKAGNFEHPADMNQYQASMGDINNILSGTNGTIGQLLAATKLAGSNFDTSKIQQPVSSGNNGTSGGAGGSSGGTSGQQNMSQLPTSITSSPQWQQLSADQQALIKLYYSSSQAGTAEQKAKIDLALNEAIKIADPWLKEQINIVKDELTRGVAGIESDYQSKSNTLNDRIKGIQEDLAYNKQNLTLDQQTELAQQLRKYKGDLFNVQQSAAEAGLAFSSPRTTAESNLSSTNQDIVQSTQQKYGRALREQEIQAQRNLQALQQSAIDLQTGKTSSLTELQRQSEKQLGSNTTPIVPGVNQLGGISGTLPGQQGQYVTGLTGSLLNNPLTQLLK